MEIILFLPLEGGGVQGSTPIEKDADGDVTGVVDLWVGDGKADVLGNVEGKKT